MHSLPSDCKFNIIGFGSHYEKLFDEAVRVRVMPVPAVREICCGIDIIVMIMVNILVIRGSFTKPNPGELSRTLTQNVSTKWGL